MAKKKDSAIKVLEYYHKTFNKAPGKYVLYDLMKEFNFLSPTYLGRATREDLYILEGQRSVVLYIMQKMKIKPEDIDKEIDSYLQHNEHIYNMEE